jgi:hypothetical protein
MITKLAPLTTIILMVASSVPYAVYGDWRRCVYWLAAAIINIVVTY